MRHGFFADPAESEASHGDAELDAVQDFVEFVVQFADGARADASFFNELLEARVSDADERVSPAAKKALPATSRITAMTRMST
jgi:hypothetical protein